MDSEALAVNLAREKLFEIDIVRREMRNLVQEHCNLLTVNEPNVTFPK